MANSQLKYSDQLTVYIAEVPHQITTFQQEPLLSNSNTIGLKWEVGDKGGIAIEAYKIIKDNGAGVYFLLYSGWPKERIQRMRVSSRRYLQVQSTRPKRSRRGDSLHYSHRPGS